MRWNLSILGMMLAFMIPFASNSEASDHTASARTVLRVGFFQKNGFQVEEQSHQMSGFGYALMQNLAIYGNFSYEYLGCDKSWAQGMEMLERGEIDLLMGAQEAPERNDQFDFSIPIGYFKTILTARAGNLKYVGGDYRNWNGMRVGMARSIAHNRHFENFASEHGFTYTPVWFEDYGELIEALQKGSSIDAAVTDSLRRMDNEWLLASFSQTPFRIMVKKGNQELLDQLNAAIEQLHTQQPNLTNSLYPKYYPFNDDIGLTFSASEREFITECKKSGRVFTVTINPDRPPFSLVQENEFVGIIKHISDQALQRTGLDFQWVVPKSRAEYDEMLEQHRVDLVMDMRANYNRAEQKHYILIPAWLKPPVSMVKRKNDFASVSSVAALKETEFIPQIRHRYGEAIPIDYYDSIHEAWEAIKSGKNSVLYLYAATAELLLSRDHENRLVLETAQGFSADFSAGVSKQINSAFSSIISQAMGSLTQAEIYTTYDEYTSLQKRDLTLADYYYARPLLFGMVGLGVVLFLALALGAFLFYRHRVFVHLKQAGEKTRRMLEEQTITLNSIGDAVVVTDEFYCITMMNPVMEKICGYSLAEAYGKSAEELFPLVSNQNGAMVALPLKEAMEQDKIVEMIQHTDLICHDGHRIHVADSAAPIHDETGRVTGGIMILRDITQEYEQHELMLKNLEETRTLNQKLLILQEKHNLFLNNMPIYVLTKDINDHFRYVGCTLSAAALVGIPEAQMVGKTDFDLNPEYERAMAIRKNDEACVAQLRATDHLVTQESFYTSEGELRYCECYRKIIVDSDGRELLYVVASDITELKAEKQRATDNLEWFRMTMLSIGDGVIATDANGKITLMNPVAEQLTGVVSADAIGRAHEQIFKISDSQTHKPMMSPIEQALQAGTSVSRSGQIVLQDAKGGSHYIADSAAPIRSNAGVVIGAILIFRDVTGESQRQNELETILANFNSVADFAHIASFRFNARTRALSGSKLLAQFWPSKDGRAVDEEEWMHPDDVPCSKVFCEDVLSGREESVSYSYRVPQGERMSYYRVQIRRDPLNPEELTGIVQDVTEFITNLNERQTIESLWDLVINSIPVSLFVKDAKQNFKYVICNDSFAKYLDRPIKEIIGKTDAELFLQENDVRNFVEKDQQVMDGKCNLDFYETVSLKNGEPRQFRTVKMPFDKLPDRSLLIGLSVDVTELRELADTHQMMHKAFETLFGAENLEQKLSMVLAQVCNYIGATRAYILRRVKDGTAVELYSEYVPEGETSWFEHTKLEVPKEWCEQSQWVQDLDAPGVEELVRKIAPNIFAKHIPLKIRSLYLSPLVLKGERFGHVVFVFRQKPIYRISNLSDNLLMMTTHMLELVIFQYLSRQELEIATKNATAAEKAKGLFIASVSHEIRTPLNAIIGYSELLKNDGSASGQVSEYLENIAYAGNALLQLLNDVLDLSKLEAGRMQLKWELLDLSELATESMSVFSLQAAAKGLRLVNRIANLPLMELDQIRIRQIIFNLMGNALKFTDHGFVELSATFKAESSDRGTLMLAVRDTGRGISVEDQSKLMTPYVQLPQDGKPQVAQLGTGLGLSICKRLAEKMGGQAWLKSAPGKGSTFGITLENIHYQDRMGERSPVRDTQSFPESRLSSLSVLLVDDVPMNLKVLQAMCLKLGIHRIQLAESAKQAMKILQENQIDFVLTDLWMPKENGAQFARRMRDQGFHIPVFAVTADADSSESYDRNLFTGILLKPISLARLRAIFEEKYDGNKGILSI